MVGAKGRRLSPTEVAMRLSYASSLMADAAAALDLDDPGLRDAIEFEAGRVRELVEKARSQQRR